MESQIAQAWQLLDEGSFEAAREIGQQLIKAKLEEGYRIVAATWEAAESWEEAIHSLQEGVEVLENSWQLWLSLGNMQSNLQNYEEAFEAFERAEACPEVEIHWIQLNKAVVHARMLNFDESLNTLQTLTESPVKNQAFLLKIQFLDQLGRHDLILSLVDEELESLDVPQDEEGAHQMGHICAIIAGACWNEEENETKTLYYLEQAIHYDRQNEEALWLMREMNPNFAEEGKYYSIVVQGLLRTGEDGNTMIPFFTTYEIVADNEEETLEFVKLYDVKEIDRDSLKIVDIEIEELDEEMDDAKGIYAVGGFAFIDTEEDTQSSQ